MIFMPDRFDIDRVIDGIAFVEYGFFFISVQRVKGTMIVVCKYSNIINSLVYTRDGWDNH